MLEQTHHHDYDANLPSRSLQSMSPHKDTTTSPNSSQIPKACRIRCHVASTCRKYQSRKQHGEELNTRRGVQVYPRMLPVWSNRGLPGASSDNLVTLGLESKIRAGAAHPVWLAHDWSARPGCGAWTVPTSG